MTTEEYPVAVNVDSGDQSAKGDSKNKTKRTDARKPDPKPPQSSFLKIFVPLCVAGVILIGVGIYFRCCRTPVASGVSLKTSRSKNSSRGTGPVSSLKEDASQLVDGLSSTGRADIDESRQKLKEAIKRTTEALDEKHLLEEKTAEVIKEREQLQVQLLAAETDAQVQIDELEQSGDSAETKSEAELIRSEYEAKKSELTSKINDADIRVNDLIKKIEELKAEVEAGSLQVEALEDKAKVDEEFKQQCDALLQDEPSAAIQDTITQYKQDVGVSGVKPARFRLLASRPIRRALIASLVIFAILAILVTALFLTAYFTHGHLGSGIQFFDDLDSNVASAIGANSGVSAV